MLEGNALGQELADLQVGVDARFQPPVQLEEQVLAEAHVRVALLDAEHVRRQRVAGVAAQPGKDARGGRDDVAACAGELLALADHLQQDRVEARVPHGIIQHAFGLGCAQHGDYGHGTLASQNLGLFAGNKRQRQHVGLRLACRKADFDQGQIR